MVNKTISYYEKKAQAIHRRVARKVFTEGQAAIYLDIPRDRLRHEVNAGRLGFVGSDQHRRFILSELNRWKQNTIVPPTQDMTGIPRTKRQLTAAIEKLKRRKRDDG